MYVPYTTRYGFEVPPRDVRRKEQARTITTSGTCSYAQMTRSLLVFLCDHPSYLHYLPKVAIYICVPIPSPPLPPPSSLKHPIPTYLYLTCMMCARCMIYRYLTCTLSTTTWVKSIQSQPDSTEKEYQNPKIHVFHCSLDAG